MIFLFKALQLFSHVELQKLRLKTAKISIFSFQLLFFSKHNKYYTQCAIAASAIFFRFKRYARELDDKELSQEFLQFGM